MKNAKEYLINRTEELALEKYDKDYYDLPPKIQETLWAMAERDWADYLGGYIDYALDMVGGR